MVTANTYPSPGMAKGGGGGYFLNQYCTYVGRHLISTGKKVVLFCLELERNQNKDWLLVAAGLERFIFVIYTVAFAIVSSAYI
jgi:hypothetical protein